MDFEDNLSTKLSNFFLHMKVELEYGFFLFKNKFSLLQIDDNL